MLAVTFSVVPNRNRVDERTRGGNRRPNSLSLPPGSVMMIHKTKPTQIRFEGFYFSSSEFRVRKLSFELKM